MPLCRPRSPRPPAATQPERLQVPPEPHPGSAKSVLKLRDPQVVYLGECSPGRVRGSPLQPNPSSRWGRLEESQPGWEPQVDTGLKEQHPLLHHHIAMSEQHSLSSCTSYFPILSI